jgi:hypothetical protein
LGLCHARPRGRADASRLGQTDVVPGMCRLTSFYVPVAAQLALRFRPSVWGTVGQWVSAIGTSLAFAATFYVIRHDARERRRSQARKVSLYVVKRKRAAEEVDGKHKRWYDLTVRNLSEEPIYDVVFWIVSGKRLVDNLNSTEVVLPDDVFDRRLPGAGYNYGGVDVIFRDNSGHTWRRNVRGTLTERNRTDAWLLQHFPGGFTPEVLLRDVQRRRSNRRILKERAARRAAQKRQLP